MRTKNLFPEPKASKCTSCGASTKVYLPGRHPYRCCDTCHTIIYFDGERGMNEGVPKFSKELFKTLILPVGSIANLEGKDYRVLNGRVLTDKAETYIWREYLLYNPIEGYISLTEYKGHWHLMRWCAYIPPNPNQNSSIDLAKTKFQLFNAYQAKVVAAVGEWPSRVFSSRPSNVLEYLSSDRTQFLSIEFEDDEVNSFLGKYIPREDLAAAFPLLKLWPKQHGIGFAQPNPQNTAFNAFSKAFWICTVLFVLVFCFKLMAPTSTVHQQQLVFPDTAHSVFHETPVFELTGFRNNIELAINTNVQDTWLDSEILLVNTETGYTYAIYPAIEYYSGVDGGEGWSEGSKSESQVFDRLPAGKYVMSFNFNRDPEKSWPYPAGTANVSGIGISIERNSTILSNMFLIYSVFAIIFFIYYLIWFNFEGKRWENSDFSPYAANLDLDLKINT